MISRILGRTGEPVGVIGLGMEQLEPETRETVVSVVREAAAGGIEWFDLFMATPGIRDAMGEAIRGIRDGLKIAGHLGAVLVDGKTDRSRDPGPAGEAFHDLLRRLHTDHVDALMLFFVDEPDDYERTFGPGGLAELALRLKEAGKARFLGMSTHSVPSALKAVRSGLLDVLMFPVNPAFDLQPGSIRLEALWEAETYRREGGARKASPPDRRELYAECARRGVAIVAMKPFAAGLLLDAKNPSGIALSPVQYLHYALSQPGVCVAVPGCRSVQHVRECLRYIEATEAERDYSALSATDLWKLEGRCMYCNHCLPCPAGIDVAAVTRLLDAGRAGMSDALRGEYRRLDRGGGACTACGLCMERCPFGVDVPAAMKEAAAFFGA